MYKLKGVIKSNLGKLLGKGMNDYTLAFPSAYIKSEYGGHFNIASNSNDYTITAGQIEFVMDDIIKPDDNWDPLEIDENEFKDVHSLMMSFVDVPEDIIKTAFFEISYLELETPNRVISFNVKNTKIDLDY